MYDTLTLESIVFSALIKLSSSADDLLWLPPYASNGRKLATAALYTATLLGVVLLSYIVAMVGGHLISDEKLLKIASGLLLMAFAVFYLRVDKDLGGKGVVAITFLGSLDELGIFTALFAAKYVGVASAIIGTFFAAAIVVLAVEVFTRLTTPMRYLSRIPVWVIIFLIGGWICIEGSMYHA